MGGMGGAQGSQLPRAGALVSEGHHQAARCRWRPACPPGEPPTLPGGECERRAGEPPPAPAPPQPPAPVQPGGPRATVPAAAARARAQRPPRPRPASPRWTALREGWRTGASGCRRSTRSGWLNRYFLSQSQILASWLKNLIEGFSGGSGGERKKQLLKQLLDRRRRALPSVLAKLCKQLSFSFTHFWPWVVG